MIERCFMPKCENEPFLRLLRENRDGKTDKLVACREHTDHFHDFSLAVKYGLAKGGIVEEVGWLRRGARDEMAWRHLEATKGTIKAGAPMVCVEGSATGEWGVGLAGTD